MWQLILGSFSLSILHALIPNHWLPLIAISQAEKWNMKESLFATFLTIFFHLLSSIIIGFLIGFAGIKLFEHFEHISHIGVPLIFVLLGIVFLLIGIKKEHHHHHEVNIKNKRSKTAIIVSLSIGMFFSPCIELEAYYLEGAKFGIEGLFIISIVYLIVTLLLILGLVYLGIKGIKLLKWHFLEKHSKTLTGILLIILGFVAYFVEYNHH